MNKITLKQLQELKELRKPRVTLQVPIDVYQQLQAIQNKMKSDAEKLLQKPVAMPMPKVLRAILIHNKNYIEVPHNRLLKVVKGERGEKD